MYTCVAENSTHSVKKREIHYIVIKANVLGFQSEQADLYLLVLIESAVESDIDIWPRLSGTKFHRSSESRRALVRQPGHLIRQSVREGA